MNDNQPALTLHKIPAYTGNLLKDLAVLLGSVTKWLVFLVVTLIAALVACVLAIFQLANAAHVVARTWGRTLLFCSGVKVHVHQRENLHRGGPVIVMSNHQSLFDVLVMYAALDIQFRWMAKDSIFKIPLFGWAMAGAGYIPVVRDDKKKALHALFEAAEKIQGGKSVIIFPEGTRGYPDGGMRPFKKGGFILAKKAGVVIQPLTIEGARRIVPKQKEHLLQRIHGGTVDVYIHAPIAPAAFAKRSVDQLSETLRGVIGGPLH